MRAGGQGVAGNRLSRHVSRPGAAPTGLGPAPISPAGRGAALQLSRGVASRTGEVRGLSSDIDLDGANRIIPCALTSRKEHQSLLSASLFPLLR